MSKTRKVLYFCPLQFSYVITGYKNETDDLSKEKLFLVMNADLESAQELIFTMNDILKSYFKITDSNIYHRLVIDAGLTINFASRSLKNVDFLINLTNMQFSGTKVNNSGQIEIFNLQQLDNGIIRKCDLLCYICKTVNSQGDVTYTEEFAFEEHHHLEDKIKVITTKRIEDYEYSTSNKKQMTIFEDMLNYLNHIVSNINNINWSWGE